MGRIKTRFIKRVTHQLVDLHGDEFTDNFEKNKELLNQYVIIQSKLIRNRIAGYIVHLVKMRNAEDEGSSNIV